MPLDRKALDARIDLRVSQLRELAAWTFVAATDPGNPLLRKALATRPAADLLRLPDGRQRGGPHPDCCC